MTREQALPYVSVIVDDAGGVVTPGDPKIACNLRDVLPTDRLVGWQCGFEPMFVAVRSSIGNRIDDCDAEDIAAEYLEEKEWFAEERTDCDYII